MKKTLLSIACLLGGLLSNAQSGAALNFDGANDYVAIPSGLNVANQSFTIEFWIKRNGSGNADYVVSQQSSQTTNNALHIGFRDNNAFTFAFYGNDLDVNNAATTDGNYHHWACVYNAGQTGNNRFIYLDGNLVANDNASGNYTGSGALYLGLNGFSGELLNGELDETRVWNVARTPCEIISYMNCEIPTSATGLIANYHFNQGVASGTNATETTLMDASGNLNNGTVSNFSLAGPSSNWIAPGGVISGNVTPSVCPPASALNFAAGDQVALNPINISGNSARTVEFWIKTSNTGDFQNPFSSGNANTGEAFNIKVTPSGHLGFMGFFYDFYPSSGTFIADNAFHHVAITYDGAIMSAYIDGNHEWDFATNLNTTGENNYIGKSNHNGYEQYFSGTIDELRIWNTVRSRCEIISYKNCEISSSSPGLVANYHFNQGLPSDINTTETSLIDASGNANTGTLSNFALTGSFSNWVSPGAVPSGFSTPVTCPFASALNFDGYDDGVNLGNAINTVLNPLNTITVEAWVNPSTVSGLGVIIGNYATGNGDMQFLLRRDFDEYAFWVSEGTGFNVVTSGPATVLTGTWQHVAGVWDGSELKIYIDGVLKATTAGVTGSSLDNISNPVVIGHNNMNENFSGSIDETRIWTSVRTLCDINTYMNSEIPNSMTGLLANYHFNQGLAAYSNAMETILWDASGNGYNGSLSNFGLTGTASNWVAPGGVVSGYSIALAPPSVTVNSGTICAGESFTMVPGGAVTYTYSGGTDVVTPASDATYTVTGADAIGCENTAVSSVMVNPLPVVSVNSGTVCAGESFTMVPGGAVTYTYSDGTDVVTPASDATYTVTGADATGCENTAVSSVMVNSLPVVTVNSGTVCAGQAFTMTPGGAVTYTFSEGSNVYVPVVGASYTVTGHGVNGTDANGCVGYGYSYITAYDPPAVAAATSNTLLCTGETATISVTGDATSYVWSTAENTADIVVSPTTQTTYTVVGTDANGCSGTATVTQDVSLCTGIAMLTGQGAPMVSVYPNPNTGTFIVDLIASSHVIVANALGQTIIDEMMEAGKTNLTIHGQPAGIYFVKIIIDNKQQVIKIIKE